MAVFAALCHMRRGSQLIAALIKNENQEKNQKKKGQGGTAMILPGINS